MITPTKYYAKDNNYDIREKEVYDFLQLEYGNKDSILIYHNLVIDFPGVDHREIDFCILSPFGLIAIEVKAGNYRIVDGKFEKYSRDKNEWIQCQEEEGNFKDPVQQINTASEALARFFTLHYTKHPVPPKIQKWILVLNKHVSTLPSNVGEIGILTFKTYKESLKSVLNSTVVNLNQETIEEYGNSIIKNCKEYYSFKKRNLKHGEELLKLSSEQKDITKNLLNTKILLEGIAGSGKTMLAIEAARRAAENKQKTLVICHSSRLNQYLRDSLEDCKEYVHIETMQGHLNYLYNLIEFNNLNPNFQVGEQVLKNEVHYLKIVRPAGVLSVINRMIGITKYDFLIIDEAQDLLTENEMKILSYSLSGGFKNGNWMICYDREQALYGEIDSGLSYLNQFQPDSKKLTVNIRNPRDNFKFAKVFSKVMDAQTRLKNYSTLNVIPYKTIPEGKDILIEFMIKVVKKRNLQPQDITILSPKKKSHTEVLGSQSVLRKGKNSFKIKNLSKGTYEKDIVSFCEIDSYKGMENKCIVLTGIEDFSKKENDQLIYIALTRATHMVLVLYPESARKGLLDRMVGG